MRPIADAGPARPAPPWPDPGIPPSPVAGLPKVWTWERQQLIVDKTNPLCLPIRMASEIRKPIEDLSQENKLRFRAAQVMMEGITHDEANKVLVQSPAVQIRSPG